MSKMISMLAKGIAHMCVRNNTPLEQYHCDNHITDEQMKAFNKAVVNNLSAVLSPLLEGSEVDTAIILTILADEASQVRSWNEPEPTDLIKNSYDVLNMLKKHRGASSMGVCAYCGKGFLQTPSKTGQQKHRRYCPRTDGKKGESLCATKARQARFLKKR